MYKDQDDMRKRFIDEERRKSKYRRGKEHGDMKNGHPYITRLSTLLVLLIRRTCIKSDLSLSLWDLPFPLILFDDQKDEEYHSTCLSSKYSVSSLVWVENSKEKSNSSHDAPKKKTDSFSHCIFPHCIFLSHPDPCNCHLKRQGREQ